MAESLKPLRDALNKMVRTIEFQDIVSYSVELNKYSQGQNLHFLGHSNNNICSHFGESIALNRASL